jgi:RNA polymerase sigma-70 factor (ECF subfamily)
LDANEERWADALRRAARGDGEEYARFLGELAAALRPVVARRCDAVEAEDVVQEVLLAIHAKRATWDGKRPVLPWIRAIARHKLTDALRRHYRQGRHLERPLADLPDEAGAAAAPAMPLDLDRHLAGLPERQRVVVRALGVEGATVPAVAERFRISRVAVRVAFHRGLAALARRAAAEGEAAR